MTGVPCCFHCDNLNIWTWCVTFYSHLFIANACGEFADLGIFFKAGVYAQVSRLYVTKDVVYNIIITIIILY